VTGSRSPRKAGSAAPTCRSKPWRRPSRPPDERGRSSLPFRPRALITLLLLLLASPLAARPPNLLVILFDDLGYSDLGCYGSEIATPHLDRLAADGLRFTRFYNTGRCAPSRAALLSGRHAHEVGLGWLTNDFGHPGYREQIDRSVPLLPERLEGYRRYAAGKWHLCAIDPDTGAGPRENWPLARGFDRYFGTIYGTGSYWRPPTLTDGTDFIPHDSLPADFHYTDAIAGNADTFLRDHARDHREQPFFLYLAHFAPHAPLHARPEDRARYRGKYDAGPEALRATRLERQRELGVIPERWADSPADPELPRWDTLDPGLRTRLATKMELYAAQIHRADLAIGRTLETLRELELLEDTLILVLSDNGPAKTGDAFGFTDANRDQPLLDRDSYHYIGRLWSQASNAPFRHYKGEMHEGGIASPLIAHWPAGLERRGIDRDTSLHITDLTATLLDAADAEASEADRGTSFLPLLRGEAFEREVEFHFEHEGHRALIRGPWKALWPAKNGPWELYDLRSDRPESRDLAAERPELTRELAERWSQLADRYQVLDHFPAPWAN